MIIMIAAGLLTSRRLLICFSLCEAVYIFNCKRLSYYNM